jgi:anti-sigma B factor antagonist
MVPTPESALLAMSSELVGDDIWCVRVTGEIDLSNSTRVAATLMAPAKTPAIMIVIADFTEVRFLDAAGLGALVEAHKVLAQAGKALKVFGAQGLVARVLTFTDVGRLVGVTLPGVDEQAIPAAGSLTRNPT